VWLKETILQTGNKRIELDPTITLMMKAMLSPMPKAAEARERYSFQVLSTISPSVDPKGMVCSLVCGKPIMQECRKALFFNFIYGQLHMHNRNCSNRLPEFRLNEFVLYFFFTEIMYKSLSSVTRFSFVFLPRF
jgi:hypothetical protein